MTQLPGFEVSRSFRARFFIAHLNLFTFHVIYNIAYQKRNNLIPSRSGCWFADAAEARKNVFKFVSHKLFIYLFICAVSSVVHI